MKKNLVIGAGTLAFAALDLGSSLPPIVHSLGLHPAYEGERYSLTGRRALIIISSHGILNAPGETEGPATGVMA